MNEEELKEWHKIGDKLTGFFGICGCQRKLKTIVDNLVSIHDKCLVRDFNFTGAEWLILALLDTGSTAICHGVNCEYPILIKDDPFWIWIMEVKDNPYLTDN